MYDVVIAGSGPAGSSLARHAAGKGLSVMLLEKQKVPRAKPCAGLVSRKALEELDFGLPAGLTSREVKGIRLIDGDFREFDHKTPRVLGRTVKRSQFDWFLTEKALEAGCQFQDDTSFTGFREEGGRLVVSTSRGDLEARFLAGADGVYSKVARRGGVRKKWQPWDLGFTLHVDIPCSGRERNIDPEMAELYGVSFPFSLGWLFHHGDYLNLGIGTARLGQKRLFKVFRHWLDRLRQYKNLELADYKIQGYYLPAGGIKRPLYRDRVFLVGDAAGFVDPFSGEGIYLALRSGRFLAEEISRGLGGGRVEETGRRYSRRCYGEFFPELRLSLAISILLGKKDLFFKGVRRDSFLASSIARVMEQTGGYRGMLKDTWTRIPGLLVPSRARG